MTTPVFDYRQNRGLAIAQVESNVVRLSQHEYKVKSQHSDKWYTVIATENGWNCECPDFQYRGVKCKHAFAVELSLDLRWRIESARRVVPLDYQACLCGSQRVKKDGLLHNKSGDIQRFECLECGKRFTHNLGFERMHTNPKAITLAMQIYFGGASLRNVQKALRLQGVNVNHTTVWRWIQKYVGLMSEYLKDFKPEVGDTWRADEMYVKFKGEMKYLFSMMDDETRFWIAQEVADSKDKHDASSLFRKSKEAIGRIPNTLITDGLNSYSTSWHKEFEHGDHFSNPRNHIREISLRGTVHNNKMERLNGEVRDRERVMRGLKSTETPILTGLQIYHNFVRPHEALNGRTPAENAGIKVEGEDKFMTLIQNAQHQRCNRENEGHQ